MTNYERIQAMSVEEMVDCMDKHCIDNVCKIVCNDNCRAFNTLERTSKQVCRGIIRAWLESECDT